MSLVAYRFKLGESVPAGIRRIAEEEIDGALHIAGDKHAGRDKAIHEIRKSIKKLRAMLRLVEAKPEETFESENIRLRDVARELSRFRDGAAMIETFDELLEKYAKEIPAGSLDTIRHGLLAHKSRSERRENVKAALDGACKELRGAKQRLARWPLPADGFAAVGPGVSRAFRRGRRALAEAGKHPDAEHYHAWRKRVKDHWYHVRLLNDVWPDVMSGYESSLKVLEDKLGSDHNLSVLAAKLAGEPDFFGKPEQIDSGLKLIERQQKELHQEAAKLGSRIYAEKPRELERRLARWWQAWQS